MIIMPQSAKPHPKVIRILKKLKSDNGWSNAVIESKVKAQVKYPPISGKTIEKVFGPAGETTPFIYSVSLAPIVYALTGCDSIEDYNEADAAKYFDQLELSRLAINQKIEEINALTAESDSLRAEIKRLAAENEELIKRLDEQKKENVQLRIAKDYVKKQLEDVKNQMNGILSVFQKVVDSKPTTDSIPQ